MSQIPILQFLSVASLLIIWTVASLLGDRATLPPPNEVLFRIMEELQNGELLYHCAITLLRVAAAFTLSLIIGSCIGITMGLYKRTDRFFDPWLLFFLNLPALVVIVLSYIWVGLNEFAAILAVTLNKIPNVVVTMREGTRALDRKLTEMALIFRLSPRAHLSSVILPQLYPYLFASARSGLALVWKIVLVVELLGRSNGVGFQLHLFFQLFDVTGILAYALFFVVIISLIEHVLLKPLDRRLNFWRAPT